LKNSIITDVPYKLRFCKECKLILPWRFTLAVHIGILGTYGLKAIAHTYLVNTFKPPAHKKFPIFVSSAIQKDNHITGINLILHGRVCAQFYTPLFRRTHW
jgi:hypothetical protein